MAESMIFGVWQINGINQTQTIGCNAVTAPPNRLVYDPAVSNTSPCVKGTWITVEFIVGMVEEGFTWNDILRTHPELEEEDIRAALAHAAK